MPNILRSQIQQLKLIVEHKQRELELSHQALIQKREEVVKKLNSLDLEIRQLRLDKAEYRNYAYNTYLRSKVRVQKMEKVKAEMDRFDNEINKLQLAQNKSSSLIIKIDEELKELRMQLNRCIIKNEKYDFLTNYKS